MTQPILGWNHVFGTRGCGNPGSGQEMY